MADDGLRRGQTLDDVKRKHPGAHVIAPVRTREALIAAIYLAIDAPDNAAENFAAMADTLADLGWLPTGPVHLVWMSNPALPHGVRAQTLDVLRAAVKTSARSARPITVYLVDN